MIQTLDEVGGIGIAVVMAVILVVVAYRRGGASLARWVVVGFALAAAGMALPPNFDGSVTVDVLAPAAVGAVAAGAIVRWADRWVPADAVGVAAVALLLSSPDASGQTASTGAMIALAFAYAFTLTAGLARLTDARGRGIAGAEVAGAAALGFAAMLLAEQVFTPPAFLRAYVSLPVQMSRVLTVAGAVVVLLVLFGFSARARRARGEIARESAVDGTPGVLTQA